MFQRILDSMVNETDIPSVPWFPLNVLRHSLLHCSRGAFLHMCSKFSLISVLKTKHVTMFPSMQSQMCVYCLQQTTFYYTSFDLFLCTLWVFFLRSSIFPSYNCLSISNHWLRNLQYLTHERTSWKTLIMWFIKSTPNPLHHLDRWAER